LSGAVAKPASINLRKLVLSPSGSINLGFILREDLLLCSSYLPLGVPNWVPNTHYQALFLAPLPGRKRISARGVSRFQSFYFVIVLLYFIFACIFLSKIQKISSYFNLLFMSSLVPITMSPEEMIFTFKQKSEVSFKEAWSRIYDSHGKTEPKMTLSLLLSSFYFGLALHYRYALDAIVGGDFLHCDGDQAFNVIKKLIVVYSLPSVMVSSTDLP
jgi:hypothetical protein